MNADQALGVILNKVAGTDNLANLDVNREVDVIRRHLEQQKAEIERLKAALAKSADEADGSGYQLARARQQATHWEDEANRYANNVNYWREKYEALAREE